MGACRTERVMNSCKHLVRAYQHVVIPEPQHLIAMFVQPLRARNISCGIEVLAAVDFDDQFGFEASEIGNVGANRKLTPKPKATKLPPPQMMP